MVWQRSFWWDLLKLSGGQEKKDRLALAHVTEGLWTSPGYSQTTYIYNKSQGFMAHLRYLSFAKRETKRPREAERKRLREAEIKRSRDSHTITGRLRSHDLCLFLCASLGLFRSWIPSNDSDRVISASLRKRLSEAKRGWIEQVGVASSSLPLHLDIALTNQKNRI